MAFESFDAHVSSGIDRLERTLDLSEPAFVPFPARRLARATVAWLNERWFRNAGVDTTCDETRRQITAWIVTRFGFVVPDPCDDPASCDIATFHAERYGATGLSPNGGGARAGVAHGYCVKGIGRTPLVGKRADWQHSNGHLLLEEALREAVWSEVMELRRPGSVVPTIAVLDTGLCADPDAPGTRRALSVRPFVLRLAHFQRATFFFPALPMRDAQPQDARRTCLAVRRFAATGPDVQSRLRQAFSTLAGHIAYCHVHRIFHGGLYSANVTHTGALLDFGSTRQLPDWSPRTYTDNGVRFGEEMQQLRAILSSIVFYFDKYQGLSNASASHRLVWRAALRAYATAVVIEGAATTCFSTTALTRESVQARLMAVVGRLSLGQESIHHLELKALIDELVSAGLPDAIEEVNG